MRAGSIHEILEHFVNYLCLEEFNKQQIEEVRYLLIQAEKSETRATP